MSTDTETRIAGKVAKVISTRELILNRGADHGVTEGMIFAVLNPDARDIKDPETGEILGSVFRPKAWVRVTSVEPRMSVASTYRSSRHAGAVGVGASATAALPGFSRLLQPPRFAEVVETFKTAEPPWEPLTEEESFVTTGDPVELLSADSSVAIRGFGQRETAGAASQSGSTHGVS